MNIIFRFMMFLYHFHSILQTENINLHNWVKLVKIKKTKNFDRPVKKMKHKKKKVELTPKTQLNTFLRHFSMFWWCQKKLAKKKKLCFEVMFSGQDSLWKKEKTSSSSIISVKTSRWWPQIFILMMKMDFFCWFEQN